MKNEAAKTGLFLAAAVILAAGAAWVQPDRVDPGIFSDQGDVLFAELRDPSLAKSIEIIDYDETTATARPFKVEWRRNRWVIPSHHDYPANAQDRLAKTAGALVGMKKDLVISDSAEDHARYGVIDPMDTKAASLSGRGKRVTLKDEHGGLLADLVLGKPVEEKPGFRYVRIPGQKRVYAAETGADPSVEFEDWVDPDLLRLSTASLRRISILNYSLDQTFGRLINQERIALVRNEQGAWSAASGELSQPRIQQVINTLGRLRIKGVQPKAPDLAEGLREGRVELSLQTMLSLRPRGFHLSPMGQILAAEGELSAETAEGLVYQLRFGEVVTGTAQALEAGSAQAPSDDRYLFLTLRHDPKRQQQYSGSAEEDGPASRRAQALNRQFAEWFYVISGRDFELLRGGRKPAPRTPPSPPTPAGTSASLP